MTNPSNNSPISSPLPENDAAAWQQLDQGQRDLLANTEGIVPVTPPTEPTPPDDYALDQAMAWRYGKEAAVRIVEKDSAIKEKHQISQKLADKEAKLERAIRENNHASRSLFELGEENTRNKERVERLEPLAEKAYVDHLTKIKNRLGIQEAYEALVKDHVRHSGRNDSKTSILYIDLDGFKEVNDTFGHKQGDRLLHYIAQRFKARLHRKGDEVGRLGGDEFMVLLPDTDTDSAAELAEHLCELVKFGAGSYEGKKTNLGASIGITLLNPDKDFEEVIDQADHAMYEAKKNGKGQVVVFNGSKRG